MRGCVDRVLYVNNNEKKSYFTAGETLNGLATKGKERLGEVEPECRPEWQAKLQLKWHS